MTAPLPSDIHCARDYERVAGRFIPASTLAYVAGGSGADVTLAANTAAFAAHALWPRLLRDVGGAHTQVTLGDGVQLPHPVLLAPVALQKLVHPRGELDAARAAAATDSCMVCSTLSSYTLEDIAAAAGPRRWFQLYLQPQRADSLALLRRAEAAGYGAVVVTLDAQVQLPSLQALRAGFRMPADLMAANLPAAAPHRPANLAAGQSAIFHGLMQSAPLWPDLDWLLTQTTLPVWVKGVLHPEDARLLQARGVAGLVVSNHGGRTLDGVPASLHALPGIRAAVGDVYPLLFDGGIRSGLDIFKALALGADAVLIGRLQLYALAAGGALGVAHLVRLLREELELCMAHAGCANLADIRNATLCRSNPC